MGKSTFLLGMEGERRCSCPEQPLTQQLVGTAGWQKRSICSLQDRKPSIHPLTAGAQHDDPPFPRTNCSVTFSDQVMLSPPFARVVLDIQCSMLEGETFKMKTSLLQYFLHPNPTGSRNSMFLMLDLMLNFCIGNARSRHPEEV